MNRNQASIPPAAQAVLDALRTAADPLGSYTGTPADHPEDQPVQDADDL